MTDTHRGIIAWGVALLAFATLDTLAHYRVLRIPTLSGLIWDGIKWWPPIAYLVALVLFELLGHFDAHWSVKWLLAAGAFTLAVIVAHVATR